MGKYRFFAATGPVDGKAHAAVRLSPPGYYQGDTPEAELERVQCNASRTDLIPDSWLCKDSPAWAAHPNRT